MSTCNLVRDGDGFAPSGGSWDEVEPLQPGTHAAFVAANAAVGTPDEEGRLIFDETTPTSRSSRCTASSRSRTTSRGVDVTIGGDTVEAAVHEGFAFFWFPDGHTEKEFDATTVVVSDSEGAELQRGNIYELKPIPADGGRLDHRRGGRPLLSDHQEARGDR